jgi:hypothetical protein
MEWWYDEREQVWADVVGLNVLFHLLTLETEENHKQSQERSFRASNPTLDIPTTAAFVSLILFHSFPV